MKRIGLFIIFGIGICNYTNAQIIPFGNSVDSFFVSGDTNIYKIFYYKPLTYDSVNSPILFGIHGLSATGSSPRADLTAIADRQNALIVAPNMHALWHFGMEVNVPDSSVNCTWWLPRIFKEIYRDVLNRENRDTIPSYMIGFSAGGQFVSRYMLIRQGHPDSIPIKMAVSTNPYYYTFCIDTLNGESMFYPCGLDGGTVNVGCIAPFTIPLGFDCPSHIKQYYNENYGVLIGTADTSGAPSTWNCMAEQGNNRYERAQNFYAFSDTDAIARGTTLLWQYDTVSGVAHNQNPMYNNKANPLDSFTIAENMLFNTPWNPVPVFVPVANFNAADTGLTVTFIDSTLNAPSYWYWDFGDGDTSLVQNPVHTYSSSGTYYVCLTAGDSCVTDSYCDSVTIMVVGIDEVLASSSTQLNIQPNPFNETTTISFVLSEEGNVKVEVYNYMGQKVTQLYDNLAKAEQMYKVKFNTEGLPEGIYFAVVHATNERLVRKMVLVR